MSVLRALSGRAAREVYQRELLPTRLLWWMCADGMLVWIRAVERRLREPLGARSKAVVAAAVADMSMRRARLLALPQDAVGPFMLSLYRAHHEPRVRWMFSQLEGVHTPLARLRGAARLRRLSTRQRWDEVATHLGELLIVLTDRLPTELPNARKVLGDLCFDAGVTYAERMLKVLALAPPFEDPPRAAMMVLRTSEWVFQVNPKHWSESDGERGSLTGTACPWYTRPGWNGAHCGIFGQFQSGVSSVFGLRYHLAQTIPKHGGDTCRIEVRPIRLRRAADG